MGAPRRGVVGPGKGDDGHRTDPVDVLSHWGVASSRPASGEGVGGGAVEAVPGAVVALGGAGVGVAGVVSDLVEGDAGVEGGGDEGVAAVVGADGAGADAGASGEASDHAADVEAVEGPAGGVAEERTLIGEPVGGLLEVGLEGGDGAGGEGDVLETAALAAHPHHAVAVDLGEAVARERGDLGDAQAVEEEQAGDGVVAGAGGAGGLEEGAGLAVGEPRPRRVVAEAGPADAVGGVAVDQAEVEGGGVEAGDGGEAQGAGGRAAALLLEGALPPLQLLAARGQRLDVDRGAPAEEGADGAGVLDAGAPAVADQEGGPGTVEVGEGRGEAGGCGGGVQGGVGHGGTLAPNATLVRVTERA
jgi:hypothetical protein